MDQPRLEQNFRKSLEYFKVLKLTIDQNGFKPGPRKIGFRPDDYAFTLTYGQHDRRLTFIVSNTVSFCRVERDRHNQYCLYEGQITTQDETWMLLRWIDSGFPPQLIEIKQK